MDFEYIIAIVMLRAECKRYEHYPIVKQLGEDCEKCILKGYRKWAELRLDSKSTPIPIHVN